MAKTTITAEGAFTHGSRTAINSNFTELYSFYGAATFNPMYTNWFVNGDTGNDATAAANDATKPFQTIQAAVTAASGRDHIFIEPRAIPAGATDPVNYAETIIVPAGKSGLWLVGLSGGPAQGNQPQIKIGAGSTAMLTLRSPGCVIAGLSFNGGSSTGGGILIDDDGSTKTAFGTVISGCFFKNNVVGAHDSRTGGAIYWPAVGGGWQVLIDGNHFYDNVGNISLVGTSNDRPRDIVISNNVFGGSIDTTIDSYIYGAGGSGFQDVTVANNIFTTIKPTISAGNVALYMDLTGVASGIVCGNVFGGASGTYGAAGNAAKIPTAVGIAFNYQDGALIART